MTCGSLRSLVGGAGGRWEGTISPDDRSTPSHADPPAWLLGCMKPKDPIKSSRKGPVSIIYGLIWSLFDEANGGDVRYGLDEAGRRLGLPGGVPTTDGGDLDYPAFTELTGCASSLYSEDPEAKWTVTLSWDPGSEVGTMSEVLIVLADSACDAARVAWEHALGDAWPRVPVSAVALITAVVPAGKPWVDDDFRPAPGKHVVPPEGIRFEVEPVVSCMAVAAPRPREHQ